MAITFAANSTRHDLDIDPNTPRLPVLPDVGTVFQMVPDGSGFRLLHSLSGAPTDAHLPTASLIQGPDGTLYGTTSAGGYAGQGTILRLGQGERRIR